VKVDVSEVATVGGILLPSAAQKKPTQGEVVGLGNATAVKVGSGCLSSRL
jgi:chaperonin GroES